MLRLTRNRGVKDTISRRGGDGDSNVLAVLRRRDGRENGGSCGKADLHIDGGREIDECDEKRNKSPTEEAKAFYAMPVDIVPGA